MKSKVAKIALTKTGKVNKSIINALAHCRFEKGYVYTGYYSGSGRFTSRCSAMGTVVELLTAGGYKFERINGTSATTERVKISGTAAKFLIDLKNEK